MPFVSPEDVTRGQAELDAARSQMLNSLGRTTLGTYDYVSPDTLNTYYGGLTGYAKTLADQDIAARQAAEDRRVARIKTQQDQQKTAELAKYNANWDTTYGGKPTSTLSKAQYDELKPFIGEIGKQVGDSYLVPQDVASSALSGWNTVDTSKLGSDWLSTELERRAKKLGDTSYISSADVTWAKDPYAGYDLFDPDLAPIDSGYRALGYNPDEGFDTDPRDSFYLPTSWADRAEALRNNTFKYNDPSELAAENQAVHQAMMDYGLRSYAGSAMNPAQGQSQVDPSTGMSTTTLLNLASPLYKKTDSGYYDATGDNPYFLPDSVLQPVKGSTSYWYSGLPSADALQQHGIHTNVDGVSGWVFNNLGELSSVDNDGGGLNTNWYTQPKKSGLSSFISDVVKPIATIASFIPPLAPYAMAVNAGLNTGQGLATGNLGQIASGALGMYGISNPISAADSAFNVADAAQLADQGVGVGQIANTIGSGTGSISDYLGALQGVGGNALGLGGNVGAIQSITNGLGGAANSLLSGNSIGDALTTGVVTGGGSYLGNTGITGNNIVDGALIGGGSSAILGGDPLLGAIAGASKPALSALLDQAGVTGAAKQTALNSGSAAILAAIRGSDPMLAAAVAGGATLAGAGDNLINKWWDDKQTSDSNDFLGNGLTVGSGLDAGVGQNLGGLDADTTDTLGKDNTVNQLDSVAALPTNEIAELNDTGGSDVSDVDNFDWADWDKQALEYVTNTYPEALTGYEAFNAPEGEQFYDDWAAGNPLREDPLFQVLDQQLQNGQITPEQFNNFYSGLTSGVGINGEPEEAKPYDFSSPEQTSALLTQAAAGVANGSLNADAVKNIASAIGVTPADILKKAVTAAKASTPTTKLSGLQQALAALKMAGLTKQALTARNNAPQVSVRASTAGRITPTYQAAAPVRTKYASGGQVKGGLLPITAELARLLAEKKKGGRVDGQAGGQDDVVPINAAPGEYIVDAETVSALGDGNTDAGAKKLDEFRVNVRRHKRTGGLSSIAPKARDTMSYLKGAK